MSEEGAKKPFKRLLVAGKACRDGAQCMRTLTEGLRPAQLAMYVKSLGLFARDVISCLAALSSPSSMTSTPLSRGVASISASGRVVQER